MYPQNNDGTSIEFSSSPSVKIETGVIREFDQRKNKNENRSFGKISIIH